MANGQSSLTIAGRTWAVVVVSLVVALSVVYLGWASSYISARLIMASPVAEDGAAELPVNEALVP